MNGSNNNNNNNDSIGNHVNQQNVLNEDICFKPKQLSRE